MDKFNKLSQRWHGTFLWLYALGIFASHSCNYKQDNKKQNLESVTFAQELQQAIEQVLEAYPEYNLGISAALFVPGYKVWKGVTGFSHQNVPITEEMLFIIGSIEKNFEATLVLKLAEDSLLLLDETISRYLPSYPNVDSKITIRQLLNHSSGIFNVFEHPDFPWIGKDVDYSREWKANEVFNTFVLKPYGLAGSIQHYSSTNYLLLTKIIEKATASNVPDELERHFLKPLKLENTFVSMGKKVPISHPIAHPWVDIDSDRQLEDLYGIPQTWIVSLTHPVMYSTADNLVCWINALYNDRNILNTRTLTEMLTCPDLHQDNPEGFLYGLGVIDYSIKLGTRAYGHLGSSLGYSAAALYLADYRISLAWLINTGESPYTLASHMMHDIWTELFKVIYANREEIH